jgi:membrane protein implicated in regulation of membrane protease activity
MSMSIRKRGLIGIICCIILFVFGYFYVLNYISIMEYPPLGNTIYILLGSTFSIISVLGFLLILKYLYDYEKKKNIQKNRRRNHKLHYLKKSRSEKKSELMMSNK